MRRPNRISDDDERRQLPEQVEADDLEVHQQEQQHQVAVDECGAH
jgi:hypothetical protein